MITCPWCGTQHEKFQSNCKNCGGLLEAPPEQLAPRPRGEAVRPPPAPRPVPASYALRLMLTDPLAVMSWIFAILGFIFTSISIPLILGVVTAFVGLPFGLLGVLFLAAGVGFGVWRFQLAAQTVNALRVGQVAVGRIEQVAMNHHVQINGRNPWVIEYSYEVIGQPLRGKVSTLNDPWGQYEAGMPVSVLYLAEKPSVSALYPHP